MDTPQGNTQAEEKTAPAIPTETKPAESDEPKLPDGASERTTEEFDKLKAHNKALKEELDSYKSKTSVLDELRPSQDVPVATPNLSPKKVEEIKSTLVDENGYVDVARLESALKDADSRAKRAEDKAQQAEQRVQRFEESAQVRAAHAEFHQLDPHSSDFDPKFYELVRNELIGQMMNGEQDIVKAAKKVSSLYSPKSDVTAVKEEAVKEYKTKVTKRDQANDASQNRGKTQPNDMEELKARTLKGDDSALFKRLQASGN